MASRQFSPIGAYDWRGSQRHFLTATIWYPAADDAAERKVELPGVSEVFVLPPVAQDAKLIATPAKFPLILLSHGTGGSAISMAWLGAGLARHGFIVAAVNHPGNNATEPYTARGFLTWWERARDLSVVADAMLADKQFGGRIDAQRIAAAGFSLGGYTMIAIAGGITQPSALKSFCASKAADSLCQSPPEFPTEFDDFERLSKSDADFQRALEHASDSYRDKRIKAVFAIAPALVPAFTNESLDEISIPVAIVAGEGDTNAPVGSGAKRLAEHVRDAHLTLYPGAVAHYVFLDECTSAAHERLFCRDAAGVDRSEIHRKTVDLAAAFFGRVLH